MARVGSLVSNLWLRSKLAKAQKNLKVLDASWAPQRSTYGDYLDKHIPGAAFFDMNKCVKPLPTLARNLPEPECFTNYIQSLGISQDSHVVIYSYKNLVSAARAWWIMRLYGHHNVSVLDGGIDQWETEGFDIQSGETSTQQKGDFVVHMEESLMRNFDNVVDVIRSCSSQIIDCRKPSHYNGEEQEPSTYSTNALLGMGQPVPEMMKRGHMTGAINIVDDLVANDDSTSLMSPDKIREVLKNAGVDLKKPVTTLCYNGHAACLMALATAVCGKTDTAVYYGSWTEFGQRADDSLLVSPDSSDKKQSAGG